MSDEYLWDRSGPPDPLIAQLERELRPFAHREGTRATFVVDPPRSARRLMFYAFALMNAACVMLLAGLAWRHHDQRPVMAVTRLAGTPQLASRPLVNEGNLAVGRWLVTDADARASIGVGDIGRVNVDPGSRISLMASGAGNYRLHLARGTMHALIWAPPGQFFVETPSATAIDLGCAYTLTVDDEGAGLVRVTSGWVGFEWRGHESFIPAGAVCPTRRGHGPGTPYYEDTSAAFQEALSAIDFGAADGPLKTAALDRVLSDARQREVVTLWHLLSRVPAADRDRVFDRLAGFVPPPAGVTREGVRAGRREMLDGWWDELGLGTASWWRTWKQQWRGQGDK
ncbi:MAG: FecR domain-containing protein [Vicinamibacterales bacterium]